MKSKVALEEVKGRWYDFFFFNQAKLYVNESVEPESSGTVSIF